MQRAVVAHHHDERRSASRSPEFLEFDASARVTPNHGFPSLSFPQTRLEHSQLSAIADMDALGIDSCNGGFNRGSIKEEEGGRPSVRCSGAAGSVSRPTPPFLNASGSAAPRRSDSGELPAFDDSSSSATAAAASHRAGVVAWKKRRAVLKVFYESSIIIHTAAMHTPPYFDAGVQATLALAMEAGCRATSTGIPGPSPPRSHPEPSLPSTTTAAAAALSPRLPPAPRAAPNAAASHRTLVHRLLQLHDQQIAVAAMAKALQGRLLQSTTSAVPPAADAADVMTAIGGTSAAVDALNEIHDLVRCTEDATRQLRKIARDGHQFELDATTAPDRVKHAKQQPTVAAGSRAHGRTNGAAVFDGDRQSDSMEAVGTPPASFWQCTTMQDWMKHKHLVQLVLRHAASLRQDLYLLEGRALSRLAQ